MKANKRAEAFAQLGALGIGLATFTITLMVIFLVISQTRSQIISLDGITNTSNATQLTSSYNGTVAMSSAVSGIPDWIPLVIIASIGAILLGLVSLFRRR